MHAIFEGLCPNCGGEIADDRLMMCLPCRRCLPDDKAQELIKLYGKIPLLEFKKKVVEYLGKNLKNYVKVVELDEKLKDVDLLFHKATGSYLWSAQRTWAKRVLEGKSFAIIAPTGVGKTMFGMVISLFLARNGKRCYIVLPTSVLVKQVYDRIVDISKRANINAKIIAYLPRMSKEEKENFKESLEKGDFDVLITTSQFLARKFDELKGLKFDFIFVDDVDALLKSSKNIDRVLMLLGVSEELIERSMELVRLKRHLAFLSATARRDEEYRRQLEELINKVRELSDDIRRSLEGKELGVLVVSSATGRPRGLRVRLFRELLGFEVGSRSEFIRNIQDMYHIPRADMKEEVLKIVKLFGDGGLVFVPLDKGVEYAEELASYLKEHGVRAEVLTAKKKSDQIERFVEGELDVLIGVATYYGLLVRGLDLPHRVRYAVFAGVPKLRFSLEAKEAHPFRIASLLSDLREYLEGKEKDEVERLVALMMRYLRELPAARIQELKEAMEQGVKLSGRMQRIQEIFEKGLEKVRELLSREDIRRKISESPYITLEETPEGLKVIIPDVMTYIQASGRTSRMFAGGISRGASIVIVDDKKVFEGLVRKSRWIVEDIEWKALEEVNIKELIDEIDRDRNIIKMLREGRIRAEFKDPVKSALLIVESPSKARTIANFFGRPSRRRIGRLTVYEISTGRYMLSIVASGGHVFDLVMRREGIYGTRVINGKFIPVYGTIRRCLSCGEQFVGLDKCPVCKSEEYYDKVDIIRTLEDLAREVDIVLLGTDPDTEGEKISWDIAVSLKPYTKRTNRIEFHEVTKRAILEALEHPRDINTLLVEAQIVRRIEDRWIGFMLSEELWETFGSRRLSAGRVQTPVLGWIIERYNEYRRSIKDFFYLTLENGLRLVLEDYPIKESPKATLEELKDAVCTVEKAEFNEVELTPPPPFTTDSMIREASSLLGIEAIETMSIAQDLFEFGLITYHRTDSTRVSSVGRAIAKEYISENIGPDYYQGREWLREGAHECIRPTRPLDVDKLRLLIRDGILRVPRPLTRNHYRLYSLIFNRFMASQMKPAKVVKAHYVLDINGYKKELEGIVEVLYDGFLKMYPLREPLLPRMDQGMKLKVTSALHQRRPSIKLFSQGEVVDLMRKRGIGRPSTYAKIIRTLLERRYVIESRKKRRLIPTKLGIKVYEFLSQNYKTLVSEERTRKLEELMDKIELGQEDYQKVIKELYEEMKSFARVGYD